MRKLFIVGTATYAVLDGGGQATTMADVNELAEGSIAAFDPTTGLLLNPSAGDSVSEFIVAVGTKDNPLISGVIPSFNRLESAVYQAAVPRIVQVGALTDVSGLTTLVFENTGDWGIVVKDNTFTSQYGTRTAFSSGYRETYHTEEQVVDEAVEKLNLYDWVTAEKTGSDATGWGIKITGAVDSLIEVSISGMFEGTPIYSTTAEGQGAQDIVFGSQSYEDIILLEKETSPQLGNGNYIKYTDDWWKVQSNAVAGVNYDIINIRWDSYSTKPTGVQRQVMNNVLSIAYPTGTTVAGFGPILQLLSQDPTVITVA